MPKKFELSIMMFYSNFNQASLNTREALNEFIRTHNQNFKIEIKEVDYDKERNLCQQYGVNGIPVLIVFLNQKLVGQYYGEIASEEFETIIQDCLK